MPVISNPSNPTGHTRAGAELEELMVMAEQPKNGILLDEAYEWFHTGAVSGIQYVKDLDNSNVFITGACTKGLQVNVCGVLPHLLLQLCFLLTLTALFVVSWHSHWLGRRI